MCTCIGMIFTSFYKLVKLPTISKVVELLAEIGTISKHTKSVRSSLQMQATNLMVLPLIYHSSSSTILYSTYNIFRLNGSKVSVPFSRINPQWMRTRWNLYSTLSEIEYLLPFYPRSMFTEKTYQVSSGHSSSPVPIFEHYLNLGRLALFSIVVGPRFICKLFDKTCGSIISLRRFPNGGRVPWPCRIETGLFVVFYSN